MACITVQEYAFKQFLSTQTKEKHSPRKIIWEKQIRSKEYGAGAAPSSTYKLPEMISRRGFLIKRQKHWPLEWGYLYTIQKINQKMHQKRKREIFWWKRCLGWTENRMGGIRIKSGWYGRNFLGVSLYENRLGSTRELQGRKKGRDGRRRCIGMGFSLYIEVWQQDHRIARRNHAFGSLACTGEIGLQGQAGLA